MFEKFNRQSMRLPMWDYTTPGYYFVTMCTQNREPLFGQINHAKLFLNDSGNMIESWWHEINHAFFSVYTDEFVIMPNHMHGIIEIMDVGADLCVCPSATDLCVCPSATDLCVCPVSDEKGGYMNEEGGHTGPPLRKIRI